MRKLLKISLKSLITIFAIWIAALSLLIVIQHNADGSIGHAGYLFAPFICLPPFAMAVLVFIILLLLVSHFVMKFILDMSEGILDRKTKLFASSKFDNIDKLLNQLSQDERIYLEHKLGAGELILGEDGELITLEEHRQRKADS